MKQKELRCSAAESWVAMRREDEATWTTIEREMSAQFKAAVVKRAIGAAKMRERAGND